MDLLKAPACCGVREISRLSFHVKDGKFDPVGAMRSFGRYVAESYQIMYQGQEVACQLQDVKWRHAFFSQNKTNTYGEEFRDFILKEKLGTVVETDTQLNPNSGNLLKIFVWTVNWDAITAYFAGQPKVTIELVPAYRAYLAGQCYTPWQINNAIDRLVDLPHRSRAAERVLASEGAVNYAIPQ